jgi:hypothetical protein
LKEKRAPTLLNGGVRPFACGSQQASEFGGRHGFAKQVSLALVASSIAEESPLGFGFHAFRHDTEAQAVRERDDGNHDRCPTVSGLAVYNAKE